VAALITIIPHQVVKVPQMEERGGAAGLSRDGDSRHDGWISIVLFLLAEHILAWHGMALDDNVSALDELAEKQWTIRDSWKCIFDGQNAQCQSP